MYGSKTIHIEIVTDFTTSAFLAALSRFMSSRGSVANIYSDNATNFVVESNQLQELSNFLKESKNKLIQYSSEENGSWHFMPVSSPHFGGLWEAGIKTVKHHLKRVVGNAQLTFEEISTLLCKIEACVNSRSLTPLSFYPNDLQPLTPGYFLMGSPITSFPEPDLTATTINWVDRWQWVQQLMQFVWKRWSKEYLSTLLQHTKWSLLPTPLHLGTLVFISSLVFFSPPLTWKSSPHKYALLGCIRSIAQSISYEVSLILIILCPIMMIESFNLIEFFYIQDMIWLIVLMLPISLCWISSSMAETNRSPFDFSEGESELVSGFNVEYSGMGFAFIFLSQHSSIIFMSLLFCLMFLGGKINSFLMPVQVTMLAFLFIWVRGTLPRYRYDKLVYLAWKCYLPLMLNLFVFFMMKLII